MKRLLSIPCLVLAAFGAAAAARAEENAHGPRGWPGFALHRTEKCLSTLDLSAATRANVDAALTSGKATLKADGAGLKAAHDRMQTDIANGADKAAIGQDAIDVDAAHTKLKSDAQTIHDQVLAQLSPDEQDALKTCASARGRKPGSGASPAPPPQ